MGFAREHRTPERVVEKQYPSEQVSLSGALVKFSASRNSFRIVAKWNSLRRRVLRYFEKDMNHSPINAFGTVFGFGPKQS